MVSMYNTVSVHRIPKCRWGATLRSDLIELDSCSFVPLSFLSLPLTFLCFIRIGDTVKTAKRLSPYHIYVYTYTYI
jgi:hypothetical protein